MRSIGKRNINFVVSETKRLMNQEHNTQVRDLVVGGLPDSLIDSWEGAPAEIDRIVYDTINGRR